MNKEISDIKDFVKMVVENTFDTLARIYNGGKGINGEFKGSRLIFPHYKKDRAEGIRVSEQELRFVFVEEFTKLCNDTDNDYYYSVETPTEGDYNFSEDANNPHATDNGEGQSGNFDMAIHDREGKKVCLIEFKAYNVGREKIEKDIVKLTNTKEGDDNILRYFIHMVPASDNGTTKSIEGKLDKIESNIGKDDRYSRAVSYYCYSLREQRKIKEKIFNQQIENNLQ